MKCVALFEQGAGGTRLLGRSHHPELINFVAECFAALKRVEIEELEAPTPPPPADAEDGE